jgi:undecaprenyl-phosphate 4-deoxy-4-formamido-L-arabinose transferase
MIELSIVIPVYNSHDCLEELSKQVDEHMRMKYQLVFVDDKSTDGSWNVIEKLVERSGNIIGIGLRKNSGQDNAIMAGLRYCEGEYVVIMDDDLQHSPGDIPEMLEKCREGYDVCFANFGKKEQKAWKNLGSWFNGKVSELFLKKPRGIYLSPFKIIHRDVVREICKYDAPYPYIDGLILSITGNLAQVDTEHHKRYSGSSTYTLYKSLSVCAKHMTGFSIYPLRAASYMGIVFAVIGFLLSFYYLFAHYFGNQIIEGWTTLVCLNLLTGGLILFCLGIIGEYLGRSYLNLNRKPQYTTRSIVGSVREEKTP